MKILYIPLDERPCNYKYPQMIGALSSALELVVPSQTRLGHKKSPANVDRLWNWVEEQVSSCQLAILSIEMLVYGGLLPSRLHQHSVVQIQSRLERFKTLKQQHPQLLIFASNLIMRTPHYDSSEEEPDYYANHGKNIFRWGWLRDRKNRLGLTSEETQELETLQRMIPEDDLQDYRDRRQKNLSINQRAIALVDEGIIDFLSIPQDDSAPFGFTALDQTEVIQSIIQRRLQNKVHLYPGADEVGCTLLARAYLRLSQRHCQIYPLLSSVCGEQIIPLYEDRPLGESLKSHILASGASLVADPSSADVILAINSAGKVMQESWDQTTKDVTYSSYRNLRFFVDQIRRFCQAGQSVAIADVAFSNGGETELIELLDDGELLDPIVAYAGWNTNCNTLGTAIATAILGHHSTNSETLTYNKIHHLLEDWIYQAITRMAMIDGFLPSVGASYYDFGTATDLIHQAMAEKLITEWNQHLLHSFQTWDIKDLTVTTPWARMFEIGLEFELQPKPSVGDE